MAQKPPGGGNKQNSPGKGRTQAPHPRRSGLWSGPQGWWAPRAFPAPVRPRSPGRVSNVLIGVRSLEAFTNYHCLARDSSNSVSSTSCSARKRGARTVRRSAGLASSAATRSHFTSRSLGVPICQMGRMIVPWVVCWGGGGPSTVLST